MPGARRWLHRCLRFTGWCLGIAVIVLASLVGVARLGMPLLAQHPAWLQAQLSERLHRPVSFGAMRSRWRSTGPELILHDLTIAPKLGGVPLHIPQAAFLLDLSSILIPSRHLLNLHIQGLQLDLLHDADNRWTLNGYQLGGDSNEPASGPGGFSLDFWLSDIRVLLHEQGKAYPLQIEAVRLSRHGNHLQAGGTVRREGVDGTLHGAADIRLDGSEGRVWLQAAAVDLPGMLAGLDLHGYAIKAGTAQLETWLSWRNGQVDQVLLDEDVRELAVTSPDGNLVHLKQLHGTLGLRASLGRYDLRWAGVDGSALAAALGTHDGELSRIDADARQLDLQPLLPLLVLKPGLSAQLVQWLDAGQPHGTLNTAKLHWSQANGLESLQTDFAGVGIGAQGALPGVDHLGGTLRGDAEAFALELPAQAATLAFPHVFQQPFVMARLGGSVALWHEDSDWHIGTDALAFEGAGFGGEARGEVALHDQGGRPFVDLYATLAHADVTAAKLFWPNSMARSAVTWLNRALVAGKVNSGQVLVRGELRDWPFLHDEGRFEAHADIGDLVFNYGDDWPHAEGVHADAKFIDNGMHVEVDAGQARNLKVKTAVADIPDFANGVLDLALQANGSGEAMMDFVSNSPIARRQADVLSKLDLGGNVDGGFHLTLPIGDASQLVLDGKAQIKDSFLHAPSWNLALEQLSGPVTFTSKGMHAGPLQSVVHGRPSIVNVDVADATNDPSTLFKAGMQGNYSVAELVQDYPSLQWLGTLAHDRSDFEIGFAISKSAASDANGNAPLSQRLTLESSLTGATLDLPVPLKKSAGDALPLHVQVALPVAGGDAQVGLGERAQIRLRLPDGDAHPLAASVRFGNDMPSDVPDKGIRVGGHAAQLDVTGWIHQVIAGTYTNKNGSAVPTENATGQGATPSLESLDVTADHAGIFDNDFANLHIQARPQGDQLAIEVQGPAMVGHLTVPQFELSKRGITAQMTRLYWPRTNPEPAKQGQIAAPPGQAIAHPEITGVLPSALPPLHVAVDDLHLGEAKLGQARFESWPTAQGLHIDELRTRSESAQITADGDWNGTAQNSHTHMHIDFAADNLGSMLSAFGYRNIFDGGKSHDILDATWPGAPSSIDMTTMDGTLSVDVRKGRIPEVAPGMGRLFGLASVAELPRRLSFDFGDVFGKGLGFDSITGDFRMANGNATTDKLQIRGPAAAIDISGRTGLRARDYDQQVLVVPHVGNSLPVVGAVVAGPVGIAAGLAVQGILGHGLNHAAARRYHVTGSWDKPVMTLVDKQVPVPASMSTESSQSTIAPPSTRSVAAPATLAAPAVATSSSAPASASSR